MTSTKSHLACTLATCSLLLLGWACSNKSGAGPGGGGAPGATLGSGGAGGGGSTLGSGGAPAPPETDSVLERNKHPSRDGNFRQVMLTKSAVAAAPAKVKDAAFAATFTGIMWASPVFLAGPTPGSAGMFFAVTTGNDVVALDETDGHVIWKTNIGSSPQQSGAGCGSIHPIGILSTPVIDPAAGKIYVAGAIGTSSITRHEVHALSVTDGSDATTGGWPVDVSKLKAGTLAFDPPPYNQRSALSLVKGILYVAYGGHVGDCGPYHGWVTAIDTTDATKTGSWATAGKGEGIWPAGGMASDGVSVFAMTGNNTSGTTSHLDSEEVVRITGLGRVDTTVPANVFFPTTWDAMDRADADLSSNSSLYLEVPGAVPSSYVVAISKDGHMFLLDSTRLGGKGGQVVDFPVASSGMSIHTAPAGYVDAAGAHVLLSTDAGAKCPAGMPGGQVVMSVLVPAGSPPVPKVEWCAAQTGQEVTAPIVTTTDGKANAIVWYTSNGKLTGVDGASGVVVYASTDSCSGVHRWTSPIAVNGRIVAGGDGHLCSWTVH
jgi:hypothetical protein